MLIDVPLVGSTFVRCCLRCKKGESRAWRAALILVRGGVGLRTESCFWSLMTSPPTDHLCQCDEEVSANLQN